MASPDTAQRGGLAAYRPDAAVTAPVPGWQRKNAGHHGRAGELALSARPDLWQPYASAKSEIWQAAKPATELKARFPLQAAAIDAVIALSGHVPESLAYLPMVGRKSFWTVFLDPATADIVAFMPLDSF